MPQYHKTERERILEVKRSHSGLGIFAKEDIPQGTFVTEYTGELIPRKEAEKKGGKYLFQLNSKWVIDGKDRTNLSRYINHSCKPNCEVRIENKHILIFAMKEIEKGEEIGYDYGEEYFNTYIKPEGCRCWHCRLKKYYSTG